MRILMTSILCHSGLMTHVKDLAQYLGNQGVFVALAFKRVNFLDEEAKKRILSKLGGIPYVLYETTDELRQFLSKSECNLIHAHSHATFGSATDVSLELKIPLVVTLHSVFPWHRAYKQTLRIARQIIAVGPAQALSARGFLDKVVVIQNGVDTARFVPNEEWDVQEDQVHVLWYGRVDGRLTRGLHTLDKVAPFLPGTIKLAALGTAYPPPRCIPLTTWTDNPLPYLQKSHITFGHGRSLREAMSCGSIGMLLGHGYGGMVTDQCLEQDKLVLDAFPQYRLPRPRTSTILRDIVSLVESSQIAHLRKESRLLALRHFDIATMGQKVLAVYHEALNG